MFCCQGAGAGREDAADLSCSTVGGRKQRERGAVMRPSVICAQSAPSPLQYIYAVVSDRVAPGERPFPAPPRAQPETQKAVSSVVDTQHRLISQSEHNKPYLPFPPLKNPGRVGIIRLRCSRMTVVLSGRDTLHRPVEW